MARKLHLNIAQHQMAPSWDPEKALAAAISEKDRFLHDNPQLRPYQAEIDTTQDNPDRRHQYVGNE